MSSSHPSDQAQLQELTEALAANDISQAVRLAFVLAKRGALPIMQLIGVAGLMGHAGQGAQAAELYHLWLRCTESPLLFAAWYNLGVLQIQADEQQEAEQSLRAALAIKPDFIDARMTLGTLQERLSQHDAALASWRAALAQIDPDHPDSRPQQIRALNSVARVAALRQQDAEAEDACARSLLLDPRQPEVAAHWLSLRLRQCAWPVCAPLPGLSESALLDSASAASMLCLSDDPAEQLTAARRHPVNQAVQPAPLADEQGYRHSKLRIGYLSSDFSSGAAARLTAELYGLHQREQFEIYGFSWHEQDRSGLRTRVAPHMDHHIRLHAMSDLQAAQTIRAHEIDILVDLHGLAADGRPGIVAHRPALVQIGWLGHPGSSAMPALDYILTDAFVLPPTLAASFTEQPLYLPNCAHINDRRRAIGPAPSRASCGLPDDAFVFCSFSSSRKLAPEQFATWMRILKRVPDSVLWLAAGSEALRDNLRVAALRHGVGSDRLVFAPHQPQADYLAALQNADLCLDTQPCSSASAAADALWAGVPVLTLAGRSHAARLGGSLLHAIGLPELVTHDARNYEHKAVRLAISPQQLVRLRRRLAKNRDKTPLFDTPQRVRELERLYLQVARGTLAPGATSAMGAMGAMARMAAMGAAYAPAASPDLSLPLVSILIPAGDSDTPAALLRTVRSALVQHHGRCEILISDSGAYAGAQRRKRALATLLAAHPQLRHNRAPALAAEDNLDHCLALALGDYLAVAPPGEVLEADKISRMLQCYRSHPGIGLVACWRQPHDAAGQPLPGAPLLPVDTAVGGASLAALLLTRHYGAGDAVCQPAALLLRRDLLGSAFGHYQGRRYRQLAGVATALAALASHDCAYLPAALSRYQPATPPGAAADNANANADDTLDLALEHLYLLYEVHTRTHFLSDTAQFKSLLAQRLGVLSTLALEQHGTLTADPARGQQVQQALRQGYALLLS